MSACKLLVVGSVIGKYSDLCVKVSQVNSKHGPFEALLCVGQFCGQNLKEMNHKFEIPAYFILGKESMDSSVVDWLTKKEFPENLHFLDGSGILKLGDLRIAYLSGAFDPLKFVGLGDEDDIGFYTQKDIDHLLEEYDKLGSVGVDAFITSEWGTGIQNVFSDEQNTGVSDCVDAIGEVAKKIAPRYHFASSSLKYLESPPFYNEAPAKHCSRFISLADFNNPEKAKFLYAAKLQPILSMDEKTKNEIPLDVVKCPYAVQVSQKRMRSESESEPEHELEQPVKTSKRPPPESYICKKCRIPGHWIQDCPKNPQSSEQSQNLPPASYVCRKCNIPGHWIQDCPKKDSALEKKKTSCWFCLANAEFEKHLVFHVGTELYAAMAKGPLVDHHFLIIPIEHGPSIASTQGSPIFSEISETTEKLKQLVLSSNEWFIMLEQYRPSNSGIIHHAHRQILGIPRSLVLSVSEIIKQIMLVAQSNSSRCTSVESYPPKDYSPRHVSYYVQVHEPSTAAAENPILHEFLIECPGKFPVDVLRIALSNALHQPEKSRWQACTRSLEQESQHAKSISDKFFKE